MAAAWLGKALLPENKKKAERILIRADWFDDPVIIGISYKIKKERIGGR